MLRAMVVFGVECLFVFFFFFSKHSMLSFKYRALVAFGRFSAVFDGR